MTPPLHRGPTPWVCGLVGGGGRQQYPEAGFVWGGKMSRFQPSGSLFECVWHSNVLTHIRPHLAQEAETLLLHFSSI